MSAYLLKSKKYATDLIISEAPDSTDKKLIPKGFILKLGLITLILYFSDFLIRPFFSLYWESFSAFKSKLVSGTIYAIPGFVASSGLNLGGLSCLAL